MLNDFRDEAFNLCSFYIPKSWGYDTAFNLLGAPLLLHQNRFQCDLWQFPLPSVDRLLSLRSFPKSHCVRFLGQGLMAPDTL